MKNPNRKADARREADGIQNRADTLVIVDSRYGSTMKYAEWISNALDTDMISFSKKYLGYASLYRNVIYIACVRKGEIRHLNILQQNYANFHMGGKHIIVIGVGVGDATDSYYKTLWTYNYLKDFADSFYILPGRIDPNAIKGVDIGAMNHAIRDIGKVYQKEDAEIIANRLIHGYNGVSMEAIQPVIEEIESLRKPAKE